MSHWDQLQTKLVDSDTAIQLITQWKNLGEEVVFTNGCFDLIHYGHIHYLSAAANLGTRLIIGLNSDDSVKRLKGKKRPIKDGLSRATLLAAFSFVDLVIIFEEDTPLQLIDCLKPDVLVKGGDYQPDDIVGAEIVKEMGGTVTVLPFQEGFSTSNLIANINA